MPTHDNQGIAARDAVVDGRAGIDSPSIVPVILHPVLALVTDVLGVLIAVLLAIARLLPCLLTDVLPVIPAVVGAICRAISTRRLAIPAVVRTISAVVRTISAVVRAISAVVRTISAVVRAISAVVRAISARRLAILTVIARRTRLVPAAAGGLASAMADRVVAGGTLS
jgi:phage-related protein